MKKLFLLISLHLKMSVVVSKLALSLVISGIRASGCCGLLVHKTVYKPVDEITPV